MSNKKYFSAKERLYSHRQIWRNKGLIRKIYHQLFSLIVSEMFRGNGKSIELGSGPGFFKEFHNSIIATDIVKVDWIDVVCAATSLPFEERSIDNIIMIDVLHHLSNPIAFFSEANKVLKAEGKIIILDVQITPFSYIIYKFFHQEPVRMNINPMQSDALFSANDPFDSNQATTTRLFGKFRSSFEQKFTELILIKKKYLCFITYPLSGGFEHKALIKESYLPILNRIESLIEPFGGLFAFRNLIVLQKKRKNQ